MTTKEGKERDEELFDDLLSEISAERGQMLPRQPKDVDRFESQNAEAIKDGKAVASELGDVLSHARALRRDGIRPIARDHTSDEAIAMAAREGKKIDDELIGKLNRASEDSRRKRSDGTDEDR